MTPKELNRTMEFIVATQARLAAAQEQDRQDRVEFEKWSRGMNARLADIQRQQADLLIHQSERLDWAQNFHVEFSRQIEDYRKQDETVRKQDEAFRKQNENLVIQAIRLLNMILDRMRPPEA
jgi:hypothetical protein